MNRGAKGKYTVDIVFKIEQYLALGMSHKKTCEAVGISQETFYQWIKNNPRALLVCKCNEERAESQNGETCNVCQCKITERPEFTDIIKKARSLGQAKLIRTIRAASDNSWQAAAWMLERTNPEDFGKRERVEVSGNPEKPLKVYSNMTDEELDSALTRLVERGSSAK